MGELASRVLRLRHDLGWAIDGRQLTAEDVRRQRERIGQCVLRALDDEGHPLVGQLEALRQFLDREARAREQLAGDASGTRTPVTSSDGALPPSPVISRLDPILPLFLPQPGTSSEEARSFWRLQLLLYVTASTAETAELLASRLALTPPEMAATVEAAARRGVGLWGEHQFVQRLHDALAALDHPDPPLPLRLVGNVAHLVGGGTVKLSDHEAKFLRTLIEHVDEPVTRAQLRKAGVVYPAQVKNRLLDKLREHGIELTIHSPKGAYQLASSTA
jgi:hypothetical protein